MSDNSFVKKLINKLFSREVILYLIFGVLTTAVNLAVHFLTEKLVPISNENLRVSVATVVAWTVAVIFAFFTNKLIVFKSSSFKGKTFMKEFIGFIAGRALSLLFEWLFIMFALNVLGMKSEYAKLIAQVVVVIMNYVISKFWVFKKNPEDN